MGAIMSIPITFQNECYFIVDKATLSTVNVLFVGNVFIGGRLYKKYTGFDRKYLVEI
jgi:hypothetical protein